MASGRNARLPGPPAAGPLLRRMAAALASRHPTPAHHDHAARRLAGLGTPILLLHGRQDMTFPAALTQQAAALIPAARAVILSGAGHMTHVDQPEQWISALSAFLA